MMDTWDKVRWYSRTYGRRAMMVRIVERLLKVEPRFPGALMLPPPAPRAQPVPEASSRSARAVLDERFASLRALPLFTAPGTERRLNIVTDSIGTSSLFGGVGTALILGALLAKKRGATLRVVTRTERPDEGAVAQLLACAGVDAPAKIQFAFADIHAANQELDVTEGDRFLTTSWWSTTGTLASVPASRVDYLLQEDERMFYPVGDDWMRCQALMAREDLRMVVNTELLYEHLCDAGLPSLRQHARWFEPAFPLETFHADGDASRERRRLLFYARPNNSRNLFYRGIETIEAALVSGVLDPERWELVFIGKDIPAIEFSGGVKPSVLPTLSWREYGELVRSIDLGLCLMSTPHPSYPPLDIAASGAVVLTNRFGSKQQLDRYSRNIICADASVDGLTDGLRRAVARCDQPQLVKNAYAENGLARSWPDTLAPVLRFLD